MKSLRNFEWLELLAVLSSIAYTILFTYGFIVCWAFALLGASLYLFLCFKRKIYAESLLQAFYVFTAIYGWIHWNETAGARNEPLEFIVHLLIILIGYALVITSGFLLRRMTDAAQPFLDSFTTVFSIFATLLMISSYPENWLYWLVIDSVSVFLYYKRRMYFTAGLFFIYTLLVINGWLEWTT